MNIKRRNFIGLTGSAALLALTGYSVMGQVIDSGNLADTPEKRLDYTRKLLKKLCTDIGPKPAGSKAYAKRANVRPDEMNRSLPQVSYDPFTYERWELISSSDLIVGGQNIEALPRYGGEGTSEEGITGILQKTNSGFSIADAVTGETRALISV